MATTYKAIYKRYNGTDWDTFYFATRADQVAEITTGSDALTRRFVTSAEKTAITTYLTGGFNGANQLLKLDGNGLIPSADLPFSISDYLTKASPTYSGTMTATNGGSHNLNLQDNSLLLGYGTPSGSLAKWKLYTSGVNLRLQHDIGSGMVNSVLIDPNLISVINKRITDVANPTLQTDAANKEYVDNLMASGLSWKDPVRAASTGNVTIASALNSLDGVTLAAGQRVLLKNQTTASENGVYLLNASKIPEKVEADSTIGDTVFVENGTTNNDYTYHCNAENTWVVVSKTDTYGVVADGGLDKVGNNFRIKGLGVTNAMLAGDILQSKIADFSNRDDLGSYNLMTAANGTATASLHDWIRNALSAIKQLRGTAAYNTNSSETIAGAYDLAEVKNRTYRGDTAPGTTGYVTGDLYFEGVAI